MIAMMTPSAAPTLLLFTALKRHGKDKRHAATYSLLFLAGYLLIWALFALSAAFLQWGLGTIGLASGSMMTINSNVLAGVVLLGAGLYQFSGLKNACLKHCRSPAIFLSEHNFLIRTQPPRFAWRVDYGRTPRGLLPRLLLGVDGAAFRWGHHEPLLGYRPGTLRFNRENASLRRNHLQIRWRSTCMRRTLHTYLNRIHGSRCRMFRC